MICKLTNSRSRNLRPVLAGVVLVLIGLAFISIRAQSSPYINIGTLNGTKIFTGSFSTNHTADNYYFHLPVNGLNLTTHVENLNAGQILDFYVFDSQNTRLAYSFDSVAHQLRLNNLSGGWYRVFIQSLAFNTHYRLILRAAPANSYVDAGNNAGVATDLGFVTESGQIRVDSISPGDVDWFRFQVAQDSTQMRVYLFDAQAADSAMVALENASLRPMREVLVVENARAPLMDISLAAGTYYLMVTPGQGGSGAIGTGYRLLVTGTANTVTPSPTTPRPSAPPSRGNSSAGTLDPGSNDRRFPTFTGAVSANAPTIRLDSIGGGDSDDWYSFSVTYTRFNQPSLPVSIILNGAANTGIELYRISDRLPFDRQLTSGQVVKSFDRFLPTGTYLIHVMPLASQSAAISYMLSISDRGATR